MEQTKQNPIMRFLGKLVPHVGDGFGGAMRKCFIWLAVLVLIGAFSVITEDLFFAPKRNNELIHTLAEQYNPDASPHLAEYESGNGIDPAFAELYAQNSDIRGWISYHSTDQTTVNIEYPIVQASDNDFYLHRDFTKSYNVNGSCFFDFRNDFSMSQAHNYNLIVYGHNMASSAMFAQLNHLLNGLDFAKTAPTFTLNTIYRKGEYKVFAVMICNSKPRDGTPFYYTRTQFVDKRDFAEFLAAIRARSLYDYNSVDLLPTDEIVTLSTCNTRYNAHFRDGRTVVVARRVRDGESADTDVSLITNNVDVIMPVGWYTNQRQTPHPYYSGNFQIPMETSLADFFNSKKRFSDALKETAMQEHFCSYMVVLYCFVGSCPPQIVFFY